MVELPVPYLESTVFTAACEIVITSNLPLIHRRNGHMEMRKFEGKAFSGIPAFLLDSMKVEYAGDVYVQIWGVS
jgi:hypothetical protein